MINERFGVIVRNKRIELGWTQDELAAKTRFSRVSIANIEAGRQNISLKFAFELANILGFKIEKFTDEFKKYAKIEANRKDEKVKKLQKQLLGRLITNRIGF